MKVSGGTNRRRSKSVPQPVQETEFVPTSTARFSDKIVFVTADWGNRLLKQMELGDVNSMTIMENSVYMMSETDWLNYVNRNRYTQERFSNTKIFAYRSREDKDKLIYCVVGDAVKHLGKVKTMTEEVKYDYDNYWGAIVCSQLLTMFPEGYDEIVLAVAHPTKSIGQRDKMLRMTAGKHHVLTIDNRKITFIVREVLPFDEPVGGIVCWTQSQLAEYNFNDLRRNDEILVVDIGGGVTSFTRVVVDVNEIGQRVFLPVYNQMRSPSISMGIRTVMDKLRVDLLENHVVFEGMKDINDRMLEEGIRTGQIYVSGDPVNVRDNVARAEAELLNQIESIYQNDMDGGRPFKLITTTGGGMHSYHERLVNSILRHNYVYPAVDLELIHTANLRGGDIMFQEWIKREQDVTRKRRRHGA